MLEVALGIFTVVTTIVALAYARHAHKQSVHAPILRLGLGNPTDGTYVETPKQPIDIMLRLSSSSFNTLLETPSGKALVYPLPIVIRNVGTKTARDITLRARYSMMLEVASNGQQVEDVDRTEWIVIDHRIPDLNPKQTYKFHGDYLLPTNELVHGLPFKTSAMTKDKQTVLIEGRAQFKALVEILLYSADTEPVFLSCRIKIKDDSGPESSPKPAKGDAANVSVSAPNPGS
jgi:hypothetical protein